MEFSFDEKAYKTYAKQKIIRDLTFWAIYIVAVFTLFFAVIPFEKPWEFPTYLGFSISILYSFGQIYKLIYSYSHPYPSYRQSRLYAEENSAPPLIRMIPQTGSCTVEYRIRSIRKFRHIWRGIIILGNIIETTTFDSDIRKDKEALIKRRVVIPAYFNLEAVLPHIAHMAELSSSDNISNK